MCSASSFVQTQSAKNKFISKIQTPSYINSFLTSSILRSHKVSASFFEGREMPEDALVAGRRGVSFSGAGGASMFPSRLQKKRKRRQAVNLLYPRMAGFIPLLYSFYHGLSLPAGCCPPRRSNFPSAADTDLSRVLRAFMLEKSRKSPFACIRECSSFERTKGIKMKRRL
jgi:hypothetical protein